jgi:hypothetical protein
MTNRTARPLINNRTDEYTAFAREAKALKRAYLGNAAGVIDVQRNGNNATDHYGKVYIRFPEDTDSTNATVLGQAVEASVNPNMNFTYKINLPVLVRLVGANGGYRVEGVDESQARIAGYNTTVLNPLHPSNQQHWLRTMRDGRLFATGTQDTDSTTVSIEPLVFHFDGTLYDGSKANNIDLSSYIPGTLTERLVVVGERANDRTVQIITGDTRAITATKYGLADLVPLVGQFDDYVIPIRAVKLADNDSTITEVDLHHDLRQFINVPQPRGFPQIIRRNIHILTDYQEFYTTLSVDTGVLTVDGLLLEVA